MKKRNHFDHKDMILLVVMLFIISIVMSWLSLGRDFYKDAINQNPSKVQETESNELIESEEPVVDHSEQISDTSKETKE